MKPKDKQPPKPRGGTQGPMIRQSDVDAVLGPNAARMTPAERFEAFTRAVVQAGDSKAPLCDDGGSGLGPSNRRQS